MNRYVWSSLILLGWAADAVAAPGLNFFKNYFVKGDYIAAGVGVRGVGSGTISISGVGLPSDADVVAAYLYWETLVDANTSGAAATIRGKQITGTPIASVTVPRWAGFTQAIVYRADVFAYLTFDTNTFKAAPAGDYAVTFPDSHSLTTAPSTEGATLVLVYRSLDPAVPYRSVVIYDGGQTLARSGDNLNVDIRGFYQASSTNPQAKITHIVGDGQLADATTNSDQLLFNGALLGNDVFKGALGTFWDNPTFDVGYLVTPNASQVNTSSPFVSDALTWAAVVFSTTVQDSDGDGLLDVWETSGFTDMDGTFINLPAMGANPNVRDLFLEIDWMNAADHSHKPKQTALNNVIAAFAGAPGGGINLHVDLSNSIPEPLTSPPSSAWKFKTNGFGYYKDGIPNGTANFSYSRRHIFHYSLWAHQRPNKLDNSTNSASGVADLPGSDSMITFGLWRHDNPADDRVGTVEEQTGTLLHELGHNLNLRHGGGDNNNCKPNYQSIMNYFFQVHGLQTANGGIVFDFSRQVLPVIDESSLLESAGLGVMPFRTRFYAPWALGSLRRCDGTDGGVLMARVDSANASGVIDWNNNLITDASPVVADLNYNGTTDFPYFGFNDWSKVDLRQVSGGFAYSEGEIANGEIANGEIANGEIANGEIANGEIANGEYNYESAISTNPPAPTNLSARVSGISVRLAWNPVRLSIVRQYQVSRYTSGQTESNAVSVLTPKGFPPLASYTDPSAPAGTTYFYFVRTVDEFGNLSIGKTNTVQVIR